MSSAFIESNSYFGFTVPLNADSWCAWFLSAPECRGKGNCRARRRVLRPPPFLLLRAEKFAMWLKCATSLYSVPGHFSGEDKDEECILRLTSVSTLQLRPCLKLVFFLLPRPVFLIGVNVRSGKLSSSPVRHNRLHRFSSVSYNKHLNITS